MNPFGLHLYSNLDEFFFFFFSFLLITVLFLSVLLDLMSY